MYILTLWLGKCVGLLSKVRGRAGSALPGYVIERVNHQFLAQALRRLPEGVIIITGTNGKTTTTKLVAGLLEADGSRVLTNNTGSNFVRGIISLVVHKSSLSGGLPFDIAVLEQDEAYAAKFVEQFTPRGVVVLNIMRDQMDRFGEIDTTAQFVKKAVDAASDFVVLNAHDPRVRRLEEGVAGSKVHFFDVGEKVAREFPNDDELHSGAQPPKTVHSKAEVVLEGISGQTVTYRARGEAYRVTPKVSGKHNYFNAAAAITTVISAKKGVDVAKTINDLRRIDAAFGRGEEVRVGTCTLRLQLVKNPAGFLQSLKLLYDDPYERIVIAINDDYADGRDMSWLWDVSYRPVRDAAPQMLVTSGARAADMAVRLKYDDIKTDQIEPDLERALEDIVNGYEGRIMVFCTYTAMLAIRKMLVKMGHTEKIR